MFALVAKQSKKRNLTSHFTASTAWYQCKENCGVLLLPTATWEEGNFHHCIPFLGCCLYMGSVVFSVFHVTITVCNWTGIGGFKDNDKVFPPSVLMCNLITFFLFVSAQYKLLHWSKWTYSRKLTKLQK